MRNALLEVCYGAPTSPAEHRGEIQYIIRYSPPTSYY